jgi:hypothetical protein
MDIHPPHAIREKFEELERQAQKALWINQALEALAQASIDAYAKVSPQS